MPAIVVDRPANFTEHVEHFVSPLQVRLRRARIKLALSIMKPEPGDTLLDLGGEPGEFGEWEEFYRHFTNPRFLNKHIRKRDEGDPRYIVGDAIDTRLPSLSYDWVFSNGTIEHVGGLSFQARMALEVRRLSRKGYFVATPNRGFFIDPHTYRPFLHWWFRRKGTRLLTLREMTELFMEGTVRTVGMGSSIVAYQCY